MFQRCVTVRIPAGSGMGFGYLEGKAIPGFGYPGMQGSFQQGTGSPHNQEWSGPRSQEFQLKSSVLKFPQGLAYGRSQSGPSFLGNSCVPCSADDPASLCEPDSRSLPGTKGHLAERSQGEQREVHQHPGLRTETSAGDHGLCEVVFLFSLRHQAIGSQTSSLTKNSSHHLLCILVEERNPEPTRR